MSKRLVLDLTKCQGCESCSVQCGYFYRAPDTGDLGVRTLKERATFMVICRRCERPGCIAACPFEALERQPDGVIKRFNLRCVSCKLCTQGCPFGTIYSEMVGFYVSPCAHCIDEGEPPCVATCKQDAIRYREVHSEEPHVHVLDEHLAVIGPRWEKENV